MGTIIKRKNPSGSIVYRAQIKIKRAGYPSFSQSKTFSRRALAAEWLKRRELEIEQNPSILLGQNNCIPSLSKAIGQFISEQQEIGRTKLATLKFLASTELGNVQLDKLRREHFTSHTMARRQGMSEHGLGPISPATALGELQFIRTVLKHAHYMWGMESVGWQELDFAVEALRRARLINKSRKRERLPTSSELQALTTYFYQQWHNEKSTKTPMFLIIWLAIYTCRRQDELCRLVLENYTRAHQEWLVRDIKNPGGSKGNDKAFFVSPAAEEVIDCLLAPPIRERWPLAQREQLLVPLHAKTISTAFTRACHVLGIHDLRFHDLRHEGATRLAEDGVNIPHIQRVTLHSSWKGLERYVNLRKRQSRLDFNEAIEVAKQAYQRFAL